jgi:hypothetical protein
VLNADSLGGGQAKDSQGLLSLEPGGEGGFLAGLAALRENRLLVESRVLAKSKTKSRKERIRERDATTIQRYATLLDDN